MSAWRRILSLLVFVYVVSNQVLDVSAKPATTSAPPTTRIVSFVVQKFKDNYDEISEWGLGSAKLNLGEVKKVPHQGALQQLLFVKNFDTNLDNDLQTLDSRKSTNATSSSETDDLVDVKQNTLENTNANFDMSIQHDTPMSNRDASHSLDADVNLHRVKQSIPVLEPVKHLLNTLHRDGGFNHTSHTRKLLNSHGNGTYHHPMHHNDSAAIETEEEREMVNDSTQLKFLEMLGTIGAMLWGFLGNLQKLFAASSGSASAASSSSSS